MQKNHSKDQAEIFIGDNTDQMAEQGLTVLQKIFSQKNASAINPFRVALSGGSTPKKLYQLMSKTSLVQNPFVHFFLTDERYCKKYSSDSNQNLLINTLFCETKDPFNPDFFFPMNTDFPIEEAARNYEKILLNQVFKSGNCFDLVLLGLGEDHHTASLFQGSPSLINAENRFCVPVFNSPKPPKERLTLTTKALLGKQVIVLAQGEEKAAAVCHAILETNDQCPIHQVLAHQNVLWLLDKKAAALLPKK